MKKTIVPIFVALLSGTMFVNAEESTSTVEDLENYHRSSMSIITVVHPADSFCNEIKQAVLESQKTPQAEEAEEVEEKEEFQAPAEDAAQAIETTEDDEEEEWFDLPVEGEKNE